MAGRWIFRHYGQTLRAMGGRGEKGTARALVDRVLAQGREGLANPSFHSKRPGGRGSAASQAKPTGRPIRPEKPLASLSVTVPQSDTGRQVEDTKARERTLVKELGNKDPVTSGEGVPSGVASCNGGAS